jgi:hypothetical protein
MHGTYQYSDPKKPGTVKEQCPYWVKDVVNEFLQVFGDTINGNSIDPEKVDCINIAHGGDHGKGKFCFGSKFLLCMKTEMNLRKSMDWPMSNVRRIIPLFWIIP